jgi:hypothetical protein
MVSADGDATIVLANGHLRLELTGRAPYGLRSLITPGAGSEILADLEIPLYRLTLSRQGGETVTLSSADATTVAVEREGPEGARLTFGPHGDIAVDVICQVRLDPDAPMSRWTLEIRNETTFAVRGVEYPITVVQCDPLGSLGDKEYFAWGFMGGQIIRDPSRNLRPYYGLEFCRLQYPGIISVQCQAFHGASGGLYLATEDGSGAVKRFGATILDGHALDMSVEHNFLETAGRSFELPYETVVGRFSGDWYQAADLYKEWAVKQPWCARPTTERTDIPAWLKDPRPWLCVISRGNYDRLRGTYWGAPAEWPIGKFWPARKVVPLMRDYAALLATPVVTWMEGWEYIGAPGGPVDIFPPLEGSASFSAAMKTLTDDGNLPFGYLAGLHWTYKRPNVGYDGRQRFEEEGRALAAVNPEGDVDHYRFVSDQKLFVNLCIANPETVALFRQNFAELMDLGLVALQIDQQIGMYSTPCYSTEHGHPTGYGPWMYESMRDFIRMVRDESKARNPEAIFGYEVPCEIWIQDVDVHMHRPYHIRPFGVSSIPLFDYLYHAYAISYGGDTYMGLAHPEVDLIKHATVAAYGVQNLVGIGQPEWDYEVDPDYPTIRLMRNIVHAQQTFAREFLVFGDMLQPTMADGAEVEIDLYKHASWTDASLDVGRVTMPCCVHSVWRAPAGEVGHVLVNWTGETQRVTVDLVDAEADVVILGGGGEAPSTRQPGQVTIDVTDRDVVAVVEHAGAGDIRTRR